MIRRGVGSRVGVEPQDVFFDGRVVPAGGEQLDQLQEVGVLFGIEFFEDLLEGGALQDADFGLVQHPEVRSEAELFEVLPDEVAAVGIDRADLRRGQEHLLLLQVLVGRVFEQFFGDGLREPGPHFGGGGAGEGDDEEFVGGAGMLGVGQTPDAPLDEDGGLSRTGRRADDEGAASGVDGFLLIRRPVHGLRHCRPPPLPVLP